MEGEDILDEKQKHENEIFQNKDFYKKVELGCHMVIHQHKQSCPNNEYEVVKKYTA